MSLIEASTPIRTPQGYSLGGVLLEDRGHLAHPRTLGRVCPQCLAEDRDGLDGPVECRPHRRFWWGSEAISGCPRHRVPLLATCPHCSAPLSLRNLRPDVCSCGAHFASLPAESEITGYDAQLLAMMRGMEGPCWADGLSADLAAGLALRTGILDEHGSKVGLVRALPLGDRMELTARGGSILEKGPDAFSDALDRAARRGLLRTPGEAYGDLYKWLDRRGAAALSPFREAVFQHAGRSLKCGPSTRLFGRTIREVPTSVAAAPVEEGPVLSGRAALEQAIARARAVFGPGRKSDLQQILGLSRNQFRGVMERGGNPDLLPGARPSAPKTHFYDLEGVINLFERALSAPVFKVVPPHLIRVVDANKLFRRWVTVYCALRQGRLQVAGTLSGESGLSALLVERNDVLASVPPGRAADDEPSTTPAEAAELTGLNTVTLSKLRAAGHLRFVRRAARNGQVAHGPALASLADLERNFISIGALERATGIARNILLSALADAGVRSVVSGSKDVRPLFQRPEALTVLKASVFESKREPK